MENRIYNVATPIVEENDEKYKYPYTLVKRGFIQITQGDSREFDSRRIQVSINLTPIVGCEFSFILEKDDSPFSQRTCQQQCQHQETQI